jgi:hypothetical protein
MKADALQKAIYGVLTGNAPLMAAVEGVYDKVPQAAQSEDDGDFPFVVIGRDDLSPADTKTSNGISATCQVHIWSRYEGMKEIKQISGLIYGLLQKGSLTITGAHHILTRFTGDTFYDDPDGKTRHAVLFFEVRYDLT